jgi:hypothetical protein
MRTFSLFVNGVEGGLYKSTSPNISARKIFRNICRRINNDNFEFEIIDVITKKKYRYFGKRMQNMEIKTFVKNGETRVIQCKYVHKIRRIYDNI